MKTILYTSTFFISLSVLFLSASCLKKDGNTVISGKWVMCKHECGGLMTMANVCTDFEFDDTGKGRITYPGTTSEFMYEIDGQKLMFSFNSKYDRENFISEDSIMQISYTKEKEDIVFRSKDCKFYLGKKQ